MRILHLPTSVGGNSIGLSLGERELNLDSEVLVLYDNWLKYQADRVLFDNYTNSIVEKLVRIPKIIRTIYKDKNNYDIFHFNFGTSMLDLWAYGFPLIDLPLYKRNGKIFVTYNGDDARLSEPLRDKENFYSFHDLNFYKSHTNSGLNDLRISKRTKKFEKYADVIFALNPDLMYFLPEKTRFLPYSVKGTVTGEYKQNSFHRKRLKVVHSPTNRSVKGTDIIINTVDKINNLYGNILELILVENKSNEKALKIYREADVVIDQILIGWYGALSVEVMRLGKPVMVNINNHDLKYIPKQMALDCLDAFINTNKENIFNNLLWIIEDHNILKYHSEAALDYVNTWHDTKYVASITKNAYEQILK